MDDGAVFTDSWDLHPRWSLVMPPEATGTTVVGEAPAPPASGGAPGATEHVVVAGESEWSIASDRVAAASGAPRAPSAVAGYWAKVERANAARAPDPDLIYPGQVLVLPDAGPLVPTGAVPGAPAPAGIPVAPPPVPHVTAPPVLPPAPPPPAPVAAPPTPSAPPTLAPGTDPPVTVPAPTPPPTASPPVAPVLAPVPSARSAPPASGGGAGPAVNGTVHHGGRFVPLGPLGAVAGIGALVAAGVVSQLGRRRTEQVASHRRGAVLTASPPAVEAAERAARAIAADEALRWADLAQRYLGRLLAERQGDDPAGVVPVVVIMRVGLRGVEVMIDPPCPDAPGRLVAIDEGRVWALDAAVGLDELVALAGGDRWALLPALVCVGIDAEGAVLVNLEHAGSVSVEGDPDRVRGLLGEVLVGLSSGPWSHEALLGLHTMGAALGNELPGVEAAPDAPALVAALDASSERRQAQVGAAGSLAARRAVEAGAEPHVVVASPAPRPTRCAASSRPASLTAAASPSSPPAPSTVPGGGWRSVPTARPSSRR